MRITRAAKVAAFPLIVLALVALVACQGGPGTKGDKGDKGDMGDTGTMGTNAPIPLTGRVVKSILDNINAGDNEDEATPYTIDLTEDGYFSGGVRPYTFALGTATGFATAKIDADTNRLVLKLDTTDTFNASAYADGFSVTVTAMDINRESAESTVTVMPNRAPALEDTLRDTNGVLNDGDVMVGTTSGEVEPARVGMIQGVTWFTCAAFNTCVIDIFVDDVEDEDLADEVTLSVSSPASSDKFSWDVNDDGKIVLTGLESTWDATATAHDPVIVTIKAVDRAMMSTEVSIELRVSAPPTVRMSAAGLTKSLETSLDSEAFQISSTPAGLFMDSDLPTDAMLTVEVTSSNTGVATVADATVASITKVARGTTTVTVKAIEPTNGEDGVGQSASIDFEVEIK